MIIVVEMSVRNCARTTRRQITIRHQFAVEIRWFDLHRWIRPLLSSQDLSELAGDAAAAGTAGLEPAAVAPLPMLGVSSC